MTVRVELVLGEPPLTPVSYYYTKRLWEVERNESTSALNWCAPAARPCVVPARVELRAVRRRGGEEGGGGGPGPERTDRIGQQEKGSETASESQPSERALYVIYTHREKTRSRWRCKVHLCAHAYFPHHLDLKRGL